MQNWRKQVQNAQQNEARRPRRWVPLIGPAALAALLGTVLLGGLGPTARPTEAALMEGGGRTQVLIGRDDDNQSNPIIQPGGTAANQSLNNTDVQVGGGGNDVLIGLLGNDVQLGGGGKDILIGGTEQFVAPNSDVQFGDEDDDISIWAPGDGSDAFVGGPGLDAQIVGVIDRDANNVPTLTGQAPGFQQGVPTANLSGSPTFCTVEAVADKSLGFQFLVRIFVRQTGALAATLRLSDVEQVFCTTEAGGKITFADLTKRTNSQPQFVEVTLEQVRQLNRLAASIVR